MGRFKTQDPAENLDWSNDWTDFLADGDAIASRLWTIDPDESPTLLADTTTSAVKVTGLTAGVIYRLSEAITTNNGVVGERAIVIRCEEL